MITDGARGMERVSARARIGPPSGPLRDPCGRLSGTYRALLDADLTRTFRPLEWGLDGSRPGLGADCRLVDPDMRTSPRPLGVHWTCTRRWLVANLAAQSACAPPPWHGGDHQQTPDDRSAPFAPESAATLRCRCTPVGLRSRCFQRGAARIELQERSNVAGLPVSMLVKLGTAAGGTRRGRPPRSGLN